MFRFGENHRATFRGSYHVRVKSAILVCLTSASPPTKARRFLLEDSKNFNYFSFYVFLLIPFSAKKTLSHHGVTVGYIYKLTVINLQNDG